VLVLLRDFQKSLMHLELLLMQWMGGRLRRVVGSWFEADWCLALAFG
jgi:hypothetical protein